MNFKFNVTGKERKRLAGAISEIINQPTQYLGAPSFEYQIGEYNIDRFGAVKGEHNLNLMVGLAERGFEPDVNEYECQFMCSSQDEQVVDDSSRGVHPSETFHLITPRGTLLCQKRYDTREETEADGYCEYFHHEGRNVYIKTNPDGATEHSKLFAVVGAPFATEASDEGSPEQDATQVKEPDAAATAAEETDLVSIEMPLDAGSPGGSFTPEALENLRKMVQSKMPLLKKSLGMEDLPIEIEDDRICFPWFRLHEDKGEIAAYSQFIAALCNTAKVKKRVTAKAPKAFENEKFALRVWLIGLGMVGKEYAAARKLLCKNLSDNAAWRYGTPEKTAAAE